jgi:hypothetical protein
LSHQKLEFLHSAKETLTIRIIMCPWRGQGG